jgi:hypothetical protein
MKKSMQKTLGLIAILTTAAMILTACGAAAPAEPTTDPNVIFTQVAETVMVSMTQTFQAMPPTSTPEATATTAPTPTIAPTLPAEQQAPAPTIPVGPTATVQLYGDAARWNTQSPVDGKVFTPNQDFTFHVCMANVGSTSWTTSYYLGYIDGPKVCFNSKTYVGKVVEPGGKWCFDLSCQAPGTSGPYTTYWFLKNAAGTKVTNGEVYFTYKVQ